jgi:hypothetical protein
MTPRWAQLDDTELLGLRFSELGIKVRSSRVWPDIEELYETLARRGIRFKPHVWLSTEWFSPDGIPGIAIPFFIAHPRLERLERAIKGEAEGSTRRWRQRILRHEAGHAIDTAFGLRRRRDWRAIFGLASKPYPRHYSARPASRRYVLHLGHWYAQSHPTEDFAETFAVWLQPKARWRREYSGWQALEKLEYVDALMQQLAGKRAPNGDRSIVAALDDNRRTLREHYRRNPAIQDLSERRYDTWLQCTFPPRSFRPSAQSAHRYMMAIQPEIRRRVLRRTGASRYLFDHVADSLRRRARELDLVRVGRTTDVQRQMVTLYAEVIHDLLVRNRERYVL